MAEPTEMQKKVLTSGIHMIIDVMKQNGATEMDTVVTVGQYNKTQDIDTRTKWQLTIKKVDEVKE